MELKSAKHKAIRAMLEGKSPKGIDAKVVRKLQQQLSALEVAASIHAVVTVPGWNLQEKTGPMKGKWSMWVTGNYRLTFRLESPTGAVIDLDYEDYH